MRQLLFATSLLLMTLSTDRWLADFHQILDEISAHYANLDSAINDRRLNLPELRLRTEVQIRAARTDEDAKQAITTFLRAFGDGHVSLEWTSSERRETNPASLCGRLGYKQRDDLAGVDFSTLGDYKAMDEPEFPGGILTLRSGQKAGVIRIRLFSETEHPALCIAAQKTLGIADDAACDQDCRVRVGRAAADRLTDALERRAASLAAAGAQAIVIDITGNGGGSNWVEPAARVLTPVALRSPHLAFIKHPHWVKQLRERLEDVNRDIGAGDHSAAVTQAKATLDRALANAGESCDRSGVWSGKPPTCSLLVENLLFASGLWPSAKARELPKGSSRTILFEPANYAYHEGANRLPLSVLVDQRTASAAEYFAAILQDNRAATIAGVPTRGAGCGHTNGGIVATLANSGARLSLPDCVRYRADGTNEVLGITPDVLVPWSAYDSSYQRAAKAKQAIERAFASK